MMKSVKVIVRMLVLVFSCTVLLTACQGQENESKVASLKIARQFGLAYAPLTIMEANHLLEKHVPNRKIEWVQLANTAAIREAILSDQLDIGFMGIPPFLIGVENGMNWQVFTGLSRAPLGLMTNQEDIKHLSDIEQDDRIALPQPGSIQHILLSMAAQRELGDAKYFDNQLVSLKHPDGVQMLLSDTEITLHFTSPPYIFEEMNAGLHQVVSGDEAFGGAFTFIVGTMRDGMAEDDATIQGVKDALKEAMVFISEQPDETVKILSEHYGLEEDILKQYVYKSDMVYSESMNGIEDFVDFMVDEAYLTDEIYEKSLIWAE
jgi:NitT/TauT family transport system substrate-binding protein